MRAAIMIIETDPCDRSGAKALHRYELAGAYDEMFSAVDHPRNQYRPLYNLLLNLGPEKQLGQIGMSSLTESYRC
jgi:hypothetical protein